MTWQQQWQQAIEPILANTIEWVGAVKMGDKRRPIYRIYLDKPGGITLDEIAKLSRQINVVVEVSHLAMGNYVLEVSSPGLDRPLFQPAHFQRQVGQNIAVKTNRLIENRQNFKGRLESADESGITVVADAVFQFQYDDIDKAHVIPEIKIGSTKEAKR